MKRMVKNGDLIDVSEDGSGVTFGGNLKVGGTIIANGEIRGGDVSASKFYLGTEEMPLVKANTAGEATETLEKVKIGNVAYKVGGGSDYTAGKNITISAAKEISLPNDIALLKSISIFKDNESGKVTIKQSIDNEIFFMTEEDFPRFRLYGGSGYFSKDLNVLFDVQTNKTYSLRFDFTDLKEGTVYTPISRARVPDVPSGDGTYVLKATVSNGTLTYSWVAG